MRAAVPPPDFSTEPSAVEVERLRSELDRLRGALERSAADDAEIDRLQGELRHLRDELSRLRAALERSERANTDLVAQLVVQAADLDRLHGVMEASQRTHADLVARIGQLSELVARGNERLAELAVAAGRRKARPAASPAAPAPPPVVDDVTRGAFESRPEAPEARGPLVDHPRPKQRPTGRKPLPAHLPVHEQTLRPDICACCGGERLDLVDEVVEEKLDVQAHQRTRRTRRKTVRCRDCGGRTTAEALPAPQQRSKVTCAWLAWLVSLRIELVTTQYAIGRMLRAQGVPLSNSFLVSQIALAADLFAAVDGYHWRQLRAGSHLATDGSGIKVRVPGLSGLQHAYLEVYHWGDMVVYQFELEKGGETQATKLAGFSGTLLRDAESRYNETFRGNPGIVDTNCNAHPRRQLKDAEAVQPVLANEAGRFVSEWFELDEQGRMLGLSGDDLLRFRQERIRPSVLRFAVWRDAVLPTLLPSDPLARALRYYKNHWSALTRFLDDPALPLDNSGSERLFQPLAKLRNVSHFVGGAEGGHRIAILMGIVATCRRVGVDVQEYATWAFERLGTHRGRFGLTAAELTPAAFLKARSPPA